MEKYKFIILEIILATLFFFSIERNLYAQVSFMMMPLIQDVETKAGEEKNLEFIVLTGPGKFQTIHLRIYLLDFNLTQEGEIQFFPSGTLKRSCALWCKINHSLIDMQPQEKREITVTIKTPKKVYGGYYAALVVESIPKASAKLDVSTIEIWRVISLIEVTIKGEETIHKKAIISEIKVQHKSENKNLIFKVTLNNEGNVHIKAEGTLSIQNMKGKVIAEIPLRAGGGTVLPDSSRDFTAIYKEKLPSGDYTARAILKYGQTEEAIAKITFKVPTGT